MRSGTGLDGCVPRQQLQLFHSSLEMKMSVQVISHVDENSIFLCCFENFPLAVAKYTTHMNNNRFYCRHMTTISLFFCHTYVNARHVMRVFIA